MTSCTPENRCDRVEKGEPYLAGRDCGHCWHWWHTPAIRTARGGDPKDCIPVKDVPKPPPASPTEPCQFLGDPLTGRERESAKLDHVRQWRHCDHPGKPLGEHVCRCRGCGPACSGYIRLIPDDEGTNRALSPAPASGPPVGRRHLVYHLLPVGGNGIWQERVNALRLRWGLFTGRKIVAVVTGNSVETQYGGRTMPLDPPDVVRRYLPPDCEILEIPNDPNRWELASWPHLWNAVLSGADDLDAVLYCHAKGVTRSARIGLEKYGFTTQLWADLIYRLALDYWPEVEAEFRRGRPIVGPAIKPGKFFGPPSDKSLWHYSGNVWWARAGDVRRRLRNTPVPVDRWGAEAWAGIAYRLEEAGRVGPDLPGSDLYDVGYWNETVVPAVAKWAAEHRPTVPIPAIPPSAPPGGPVRLSVIVPTKGRPTLARTLASINSQLQPGDEIIVEHDASGDVGATPRTKGMRRAGGTHLLWMDDDDVYLPGALARVRIALAKAPSRPHLFQMRRESGYDDVLWREPRAAVGNVSTQMFVTPNDPARLGSWSGRYEGDHDFIASTLSFYPEGPVWVPDVIAVWRPDPAPKMPAWWSDDAASWDRYAWAENVGRDDYKLRGFDLAGKVAVDIGAHVGTVTFALSRAGAVVHAYEPEPISRGHLLRNAAHMPGVTVHPEAVGDVVAVWEQEGRPIGAAPVVDLDTAIERATEGGSGRVTLLKLDVEGAEYAALSRATLLPRIDRIVGEWHTCRWGGRDWSGPDIARVLRPHGFSVELTLSPDLPGCGLFFATRSTAG